MRRRVTVLVLCGALAALTACSGDGSKSGGSSSTSASSRTTTTSRAGGAGGITAWVDVSATWRAMTPSSLSTDPQHAAEDLAALRRGQGGTSDVGEVSVVEVRTGEPAVVVLAEIGGADAAVERLETEITLEPGEGGWTVGTARQRAVCYRAPSAPEATTCPPVG